MDGDEGSPADHARMDLLARRIEELGAKFPGYIAALTEATVGVITGASALKRAGESEALARMQILDIIDEHFDGVPGDIRPAFESHVVRVVRAIFEEGD